MFVNVGPKSIGQFVPDPSMANYRRRFHEVLSLEKFVLHPVVGEFFELLEGYQRSRTHKLDDTADDEIALGNIRDLARPNRS